MAPESILGTALEQERVTWHPHRLYGRWGSDVFRHYIQDTPIAQLDSLALETGARLSIEEAKLQLQDLFRRTDAKLEQQFATPLVRCSRTAKLLSKLPSMSRTSRSSSRTPTMAESYIDRCSDPNLHPTEWRSCCGWRFGLSTTDCKSISQSEASGMPARAKCRKCFPEFNHHKQSSGARASSPRSATLVGKIRAGQMSNGMYSWLWAWKEAE